MDKKRHPSILGVCLTIAMIALLAFPMQVFAEDETPASTPVPAETTPAPQSTPESIIPADPTAVLVETTPAPQATTEPTTPADPTAESTGVPADPAAVPTEAPFAADSSVLIKESVSALQETGAVLVDLTGEPIPLGSQKAAEALAALDPTGCPAGVTPTWMGGTGLGCTANYTSIQEALNDPLVVDGAGWTIYIQEGNFNENVQVNKNVKFTGLGAGATATSISLFKDIDNESSWFTAPLVVVNSGASIADGLNLLSPGGILQTSITVYQGTTDSHGNLNAAARDKSTSASPMYQLECGEPNVTINLGSTYKMILMDPTNPIIQNYYAPNGAEKVEDVYIAVNVAADQGWASGSPADQYKERQVYWKLLGKTDAGHPFDTQFASLVSDIQNGVYDAIARRLGIYFVVPTLKNDGVTPSPSSAQITFIKTCDDGDPTTINILNADGTCSYTPKTCNDGSANTNDTLNANGTCTFACNNGATDPPACTDCPPGSRMIDGQCVAVCIDPLANNQGNPLPCTYDVLGCTDQTATNYDPKANKDDGSCTYPKPPVVQLQPLLIPVTGACIPDVITAGIGHTCAVTPQTGLRCWGLNDSGQLGDGTNQDQSKPMKVEVLDGGEVVQLASGIKHTCALVSGGEVWCWGLNDSGQLGDGTTTNRNKPVKVNGLTGKVVSITAGENFTCATNAANTTMCWGNNSAGQFNNGNFDNSSSPVVAGLGSDVKMISGGQNELQGVLKSGALQSWSKVPMIPVTGLVNDMAIVSANRFENGGCAMTNDGKVNCWGGIQGAGIVTNQDVATLVEGNIKCHRQPLVTGLGHGCTITDKGVSCWGINDHGQLGDGTQTGSNQPVLVSGVKTYIDLAAGFKHTCAIVGVEDIRCWGQNTYGQLGNGTTKDSPIPVVVIMSTAKNDTSVSIDES